MPGAAILPPPPPPPDPQYGNHSNPSGGVTLWSAGGGGSTPWLPGVGTGSPDVYTGPPSPAVVNSVRDVRERVAQNAVPVGTILPVILGRGRVEGRVIHVIEGNPEILIVAYAAGPNSAFEYHYFNGQQLTHGSDGVTWTEHLGAYGQSVDTTVQTYLGNYRLPGLTYVVYFIDGGDSFSEPSPFFGQVTSIVADLKGIELYDPRENRITHSETFSSTYWSSSPAFPTVAAGQADRFNGTAATRWTFGGSGPYTISRASSGLSLVSGDSVTVAVDIRTTSGTVACNLRAAKTSGSSTAKAITVTTSWRRHTVTLVSGGTGNAQIQLDGIPSSAVLEVAFASVQVQAEDLGYTKTVASAITQGTRWAENPVLAMLYLETDEVNGAGGTPTSKVNMASWGKAAALCDGVQADGTATYSIGYVIATEGNASQYREAIRGACAAEIYWEDGLLCCFVDSYQPNDPVLSFTTQSNAKGPRFFLTPGPSRPTHVVVKFHDAAKGYAGSSASADHPGLKDGTAKYQEAEYSYDAIVSEHVANRVARYTEGRARLCEGNASFTVPFVGIRLTRGMLIELTTEDGLSVQQLLVDDFEALDSGEYVVSACHEYDPALYTFDPLTPDTPPSTDLIDPRVAPPGVVAITTDDGGFGPYSTLVLWRRPRLYKPSVLYGAGFWTLGDVTGGDTSKVNDGNTSVTAFTWGTSGTPRAVFNAGTGNTKKFGKVRIHQGTISAVNPQVAYSDDGSSWTTVAPSTTYSSKKNDDFTLTDFETDGSSYIEFDWDDVGAHQYWRVFTTALGAFAVKEIQFTEIDRLYPAAYIAGYEVRGPGAGLLAFFPGAAPPTSANAIDISATASTVGSLITDVTQTTTVEVYVYVRNVLGILSAGRHLKRVISVSASPGATGSLLRSSEVGATTGPYVAAACDQDTAGNLKPTASILTDESARQTPWIEERIALSGNTTVNSTTPVDLVSVTFTPPADCRLKVYGVCDVRCDVVGAIFVGELVITPTGGGASTEAAQIIDGIQIATARATFGQVWTPTLTGGTEYEVKLTGRVDAGGTGASYTVIVTHTGLAFAAVGRY